MRKADSLRQWLTAFLPDLKTHPDRLQIYVKGGQIGTRQSRTLSFVYAYTLKVGIWDFAGDADTIMVPMKIISTKFQILCLVVKCSW